MIYLSNILIVIFTFLMQPLLADYSDQRGMTNLLGNETWLRCADEMSSKNSNVYELSYVRSGTMPKSPFAGEYKPKFLPSYGLPGSKQFYTMDVLNKDVNPSNQGTQIDALGHFGYIDEPWDGEGEFNPNGAKFFGNLTLQDVKPTPNSPLLKLGIETVPPIITTAVLLDVRKHALNGIAMEAGEYVTVEHLKYALSKTSIADRGILPGDIVLINTGWSDHYQDPDEKKIYYSMRPGISYNSAKFLASKKVVGVGLDTCCVDSAGDPNSDKVFEESKQNPEGIGAPAHHYFLTQVGIHTLENFRLKELVKDNVELSCAIILPLLIKGSSGSPIRPIAIGKPVR